MNEGLKKFAHVNKKAFEQYNNFTKQRDQLLKRREDLEKSGESIEQLVEVLDQRKDEAIERTFKQVAKNFEEVFETLVPAGKGKLIIQRRVDQVSSLSCESLIQLRWHIRMMTKLRRPMTLNSVVLTTILGWLSRCALSHLSCLLCLNIAKVSFNSKVDEGLRIQQLSGGQKSLVALALGTYCILWHASWSYSKKQSLLFKSVTRLHSICLTRSVRIHIVFAEAILLLIVCRSMQI